MKAVVFGGVGKGIAVQDVPAPAIKDEHDVLIRIRECGICGSDLAILEGRHPSHPPVTLGHELSGEVLTVGSAVKNVVPGDHVVVDPNLSCGVCVPCRLGRRNMCLNMVEMGISRDGGFAEQMVAPDTFTYKVDPKLSWQAGALIEPLACVAHGFSRSRIKPDETAVVYGAGPMGLLWVALLKRAGVRKIMSVELSQRRRDAAQVLGADVVIDPAKGDSVDAVMKETGGNGADVAVEMIGRAETVESAVRAAGMGGRVIIMGVARKEAKAQVAPFEVMLKEVEVIGSNANATGFVPAIRLIESGVIPVEKIISHELPISEAGKAFDLCRSGEGLKVLIRPD